MTLKMEIVTRKMADAFFNTPSRTEAVHIRAEEVRAVVSMCTFPDYKFEVIEDGVAGVYVRGSYMEADTVTGNMELQQTRLWLIAEVDTKSDIVRTLFKLIMTSMEHKAREWFLYDGKSIFGPHFDVDRLHAIHEGV